jgi:muramoyltetrapeptide carboxypeptidase
MKPVKKLEVGATVGLIAPSGPAAKPEHISQGAALLQSLGFKVLVGAGCYEKLGYMAGRDDIRIRDIHAFFANPEIAGIFCMKGGDGAPRLLDRLDYELIAKNPKVFIGYSDITALHLVINQKCGFITFHGPMPLSDYIHADFTGAEQSSLLHCVMSARPPGPITLADGGTPGRVLVSGNAQGMTVGGNLALICGLMGTPYEIDTRGKILLLEDIDEANYRIDRMLTQLRLSGKLDQAAGIVIGQLANAEPVNAKKQFPLLEVLKSILLPSDKPILYDYCFGHAAGKKATIPLGAMAEIDGDTGHLIVTQTGVY